jgi:hypothetical protein
MSPARSTLCLAVAFVAAGCVKEMPSTPSASTPPSFTTGTPINAGSREAYTLAVFGDFPYGDAKIADMADFFAMINADPKVDIVVHLGDIKAGSNSPCTFGLHPPHQSRRTSRESWSRATAIGRSICD